MKSITLDRALLPIRASSPRGAETSKALCSSSAVQQSVAGYDPLFEKEESVAILSIAPIHLAGAPAFDPLDRHGRTGQLLLSDKRRADLPKELDVR